MNKIDEAHLFARQNIKQLCVELLEFHDKGILCDGLVRKMAEPLKEVDQFHYLRVAESIINHEALAKVAADTDTMKTAEEWMSQLSGLDEPALLTVNRMAIREIQLDAMKEGARRAAEIANKSEACCAEGERIGVTILAIAEQWTEADLRRP